MNARGTKHEARILVMAMMVLGSSVALAMPTQQELKKVQPMVAELMAPTMDDFKAKKKTAAEVADMAVKYAGEAETEAAKFMLYRSSVPYYVRGEAYDKAADAVELMKTNVKDVPASVIEEIISKATVRATAKKAPRLFELYRQAKAQSIAEKDVAAFRAKLKKNPGSLPTVRNLAEALATSGDWDAALKEFAKLKDGAAQIAKKELDGSAKSVELGEFWWSYKPTYENADDTFEMHAAVHYRKALAAGEITGLKKNIVEQRIKPYGDAVAAGGQGASPRTSAVTGLYCVIDLSGGPDAKKYPVSYLNDIPKGGWSDEYKTTKLVLRRIEPGAFMMGKTDKSRHAEVKKPFYIGVFEVSQKQWSLVMGDRPSFWKGPQWFSRPVEQVSYERIRGKDLGSKWPESDEVDAESFLGFVRQKTGFRFELPTETQWEYACRAGTETDFYNNTDNVDWRKDSSLDKIARYRHDGGWSEAKWGKFDWGKAWTAPDRNCETNNGTAAVGSYMPNKWGLYDMLGNVNEWCLDYQEKSKNDSRVIRGGHWCEDAYVSTSYWRGGMKPNTGNFDHGFRLCLPLASGAAAQTPAATTTTGSIELKTGGDSPFTVKGNEATLELKNGAKLEFVKCPSGWVKVVDDYEKKSTRKIKITRPFWIMKRCLWKDDAKGVEKFRDSYCENGVQIHPAFSRIEGFCSDLTDELKSVIPAGYVVRLPSIAEWEYAYLAGSEDPDDEPFGSLLRPHDWGLFNKHGGKTSVNKWGLCDFHVVEKVLDRVNPQVVNVFEKDPCRIVRLPASELNDDLFYWSDDLTTTVNLARMAPWQKLWISKDKAVASVRLVIGPDLVSEWKAKNGKK